MSAKNTGIIIPIAYPEEFVAMVHGWYRKPLEWIGVVNNGLICAGHSAAILIDRETGILEYADFGRYIAPVGKGRTRTMRTDPEVQFDIKAEFNDKGEIINKIDLLSCIEAHPEKTHGGGTMYASFGYDIDYDAVKAFIVNLNLQGSIPYDPFKEGSSNCSRFVYDAIQVGLTNKKIKRRHFFGNRLTPSPLGNVFYAARKNNIFHSDHGIWKVYKKNRLKDIIGHFFLKPKSREKKATFQKKPHEDAIWLGGMGSGAWFVITTVNLDENLYRIRRFFRNGNLIFDKVFNAGDANFLINEKYQFVYDCHAIECHILQNRVKMKFVAIE